MLNLFPYEKIATKDEFIGRYKEIQNISSFLMHSNNIVMFSKRRLGKSSLIQEILRREQKNYLCIYIDIYDITSASDFATLLMKGLTSSYKGDIKTAIKKLTQLFKRARVEPTFDPNTMKYGIKPVLNTLSYEEIMEDFFKSLFELSHEKKIVLAIDEFQQIATIKDKKIDALFRKYMQQDQSKNISYIFLGSKRHMLTKLFEHRSPLYEMATPILLDPIALKDISLYVKKHLKISDENIKYIYELCDMETKLMQHIFYLLHLKFKDHTITIEHIDMVLNEILEYKNSYNRALLDTLTLNQKKALKLIFKYKSNLFRQEILQEQSLSKNVMQSALNSLFDRELIDKENDRYFISDRAFELWGEKEFV